MRFWFKNIRKRIKFFLKPQPGAGRADKVLMASTFLIAGFGIIMLSSVSSVVAYYNFGNSYYYFTHQLIGLALGVAAFIFFAKIDYHFWRRYAIGFLMFSVLSLLLVFIPGLAAQYGTSQSWINIFGFSFQPAELVKVSFLIYLAAWLERRQGELHEWRSGTGPFVITLGFIAILMIAQPDLGTFLIIGASSLMVYFAGGGRLTHLLVLASIPLLFLLIILNSDTDDRFDYVSERFECVGEHDYTDRDSCYQINQSLIAIGSGGMLGRGIGESEQKKMYLPEAISDSIFPIIAEELGFVVCVMLFFLYSLLFWRGVRTAKLAGDYFGRLLAFGIVSFIIVQFFLNIGGVMGVIPMTGVTLPLISYGGTSILTTLLALGILTNISKYTKQKR
jgi:cell division protein FtsW